MFSELRAAVIILTLLSLVTGVVYPLAVTGVAQVVFHHQSNGSVINRDGRGVGSELIGQTFDRPEYFWGRPSATSPVPYNGGSSSGSNLGPTNPALVEAVTSRANALKAADSQNDRPIPIDLVTASGSGLDPHISPGGAEYQLPRVARARGLREAQLRELVHQHTMGRTLGVLGDPRVNILTLNLALDALHARPQ